MERIFADKIFAAEFYYEREMHFDLAKHFYDVREMFTLFEIQELVVDKAVFLEMLGYKRLEETKRIGSDLTEKKFSDFQIFSGMKENKKLYEAYQSMQRNYVFVEKDELTFEYIVTQWEELEKILVTLD